MQWGFPSQRRRLVTVLTTSALITGAFCYPGIRSLYLIPGSIPERCMLVLMSIIVLITTMVIIAMTSFLFPDKLGKVWFFQKTFCWLTLIWSFIFNSADIRFAGRELVWITYTIVDDQAGGTLRSIKTCGYDLRDLGCSVMVITSLNLRVPDTIVKLYCCLLR